MFSPKLFGPSRHGVLALMVLGLTAPSSSMAQGAGIQRVTSAEVAVVGGETDLFAPGLRAAVEGISLGTFASTNDRWSPTAQPQYADALWFATPPAHTMRDGIVRAVVALGRTPDLSILARVVVDKKSPEQFTALGLSFESRKVVFHRWTAGLVREMGTEVGSIAWAGRTVEVVLTLSGPFVVAVISDAVTLEPLATLSTTDVGVQAGTVGLRVASGQSDDGGLQTLSYVDVRSDAAAAAVDDAKPLAPGGQRRLAASGKPPTSLPKQLRAHFQPCAPNDHPHCNAEHPFVVVGSPQDLAQVRRAGVVLSHETADFGYKWLDADTRTTLDARATLGPTMPVGYVDSEALETILRAYAAKYPDITHLVSIGRSRRGRDIWALKISDHAEIDEDEPSVLLNAGHHGIELISTTVALDAIDQLLTRYRRDAKVRRWVNTLQIFVVPLVNPDGADLFLHSTTFGGRKNGSAPGDVDANQGVDLNRNYPFHWGELGEVGSRSWPEHYRYRGEIAGSEPETQAMMALAKSEHFTTSISYHSWATRILVPYTIPGVKNRSDDEAWSVAVAMANQMPSQPSRRRFKASRLLYPVDGTDQDWFRHSVGTLALLVEVALHNPVGPKKTATIDASRDSWRYLLERTASGPLLQVRVLDASDHPVQAEVTVSEAAPLNGERWITRERDGWHHRVLDHFGTYTVVVQRGDAKVVRKFTLRRGNAPLIVKLP